MFGNCMGRAIALTGVIGFLAISAPPSWADPTEPGSTTESTAPGPTTASLTMSLNDLGYGSTLAFYGLEGTAQLTVPVPHGLTPSALNATVQPPVNMRSGTIIVSQNDRDIAKVNVPTTDQAPIVIPMGAAEVINDSVTVTLRAYLVPVEGLCVYAWSPLRLTNATVGYTGVEQPPTTVAAFLPPVLRKLTIFLPQSPSAAESDTAVRLATSAAAHYGKQLVDIGVAPLGEGQAAPPTPARPQERQIVVKEGPDTGLSLQGAGGVPWMLISGPLGRSADSDTALLFSDLSGLAMSSKAAATSLKSNVALPGDTATLRELGQPIVNSTGLQPRVSIGLDQTRFGRSIHSVRMHLRGSYSPTPANIGGQIVATVGSETIDRWPTDGHGVIDRWVDVPDRLLQRWTGLDLTLNVSGNVGRCGDFYTAGAGDQQLTLTIDGDSTVQSSPAAPPVPEGLRSVPQTLMPQIQVGIGPHSFADTSRAVDIVVGLQRFSSIPLETTVTGVQQAIDSSKPAILIAADGWNHPDIALPVSAGPSGPITVNAFTSDGKPTTITLDPTLRFASFQTVFNRGRSLLIATSNGVPGQLDALIKWLGSDNTRWPRVKGLALVSFPGQDPVMIDRPNADTSGPGAASGQHSDSGWLWWLGGAWLAVAVIGAGVIVLRSRRGLHRSR
ncbi:hypothetical protein [Mycobacterium sp. 4858]|uniref:hypothetical protein n=1 Tax=Mycobacterium sp. 4858 TaxID=2057185 RepID=UPI000C83A4E4|nr:hypothetical protein [Mycobacterium sp. 4858]